MNMRMLLVSLLVVAALGTTFIGVAADGLKTASTKEYQELMKSRAITKQFASLVSDFDEKCASNKDLMPYFSSDCRMARDFKRALEIREQQEKELADKVAASPEFKEDIVDVLAYFTK